MIRYLRIAFSATCLTACVLLIVLWVRSYWCYDLKQAGRITSANGLLHVGREVIITAFADLTPTRPKITKNLFGFHTIKSVGVTAEPVGGAGITLPYWLLVMSMLALGVAPWLRWRYTLRTLLIAMTLVAVVLGAAVWLARR
jgi:hypothetical protein